MIFQHYFLPKLTNNIILLHNGDVDDISMIEIYIHTYIYKLLI